MQNFNIGTQIMKELEEFSQNKVKLASTQPNVSVRTLKGEEKGYYFNQQGTISLIDLYYNSKFESGSKDKLGQRKIFMNIGKFRTEVSAKQIDIDTSNFRFIPDDYADPYCAIFLQKDFKEWAKDSDFGELVNTCVDNFPKYGSIVLKKVGNTIKWVPLQNIRNEQTADSLQTATYVIEEHPDMHMWEFKDMKNWNTDGLKLRYDETMTVYERYGYVPLAWLKKHNDETVTEGDEDTYVDALVICGKPKENNTKTKEGWYTFFCGQISSRPYREAHWNKQHGRWLGLGVMEDLIENQQAKNMIVNLIRRSLHWSSKRILQSENADVAAKNLARDVMDGDIIEVGPNGTISEVNLSSKTNADFQSFLTEFEHNADQKAFTYEVATGEAMPSGTPFRLGAVLSQATNSFFNLKREKLGLFLKKAITDFMIPQFLRDMGNEQRTVAMFSGEQGFELLRDAATKFVQSETARVSILSGKPIDAQAIQQAAEPMQEIQSLFFDLPATYYKDAKYKFDFTVTGEEVDLQSKLETLKSLFQVMQQSQDPRAMKVLERIAALSGESMSSFGAPTSTAPAGQPQGVQAGSQSMPQTSNAQSPQPATA